MTIPTDSMDYARLRAMRIARTESVDMVWGWQRNDDTGEDEPGYCPLRVVGPCFVHTIVGRAPSGEPL